MQDETQTTATAEAEAAAPVIRWKEVLDICHGDSGERRRCGRGVRILTVGLPIPPSPDVDGTLTVRTPPGGYADDPATDASVAWHAAWGDWQLALTPHSQEWSAPLAEWHACRGLDWHHWHAAEDGLLRDYVRAAGQLVAVVAVVGPPPPSGSSAWDVLRSYTGNGVQLVVGPEWHDHPQTPATALVAVPYLLGTDGIHPGYLVRPSVPGHRFGVLVRPADHRRESSDAVLRLAGLTAGALSDYGRHNGPLHSPAGVVAQTLTRSFDESVPAVLPMLPFGGDLPFPHCRTADRQQSGDAAPLGARARRAVLINQTWTMPPADFLPPTVTKTA